MSKSSGYFSIFWSLIYTSLLHCEANESSSSKSKSSSGSFLLGVVGDILLHKELQEYAFSSDFAAKDLNYNGSYASIWQDALPLLRWPDITYGNLEGVVSLFKREWPDKTDSMHDSICEQGVNWKRKEYGDVYHSWDYKNDPMRNWFNYHPDLITDLKYSGFDVVSTANNHKCDVCVQGLEYEIDLLNEQELLFSGSRKIGDQQISGKEGVVNQAGHDLLSGERNQIGPVSEAVVGAESESGSVTVSPKLNLISDERSLHLTRNERQRDGGKESSQIDSSSASRSNSAKNDAMPSYITIMEKNGLRIGWASCTGVMNSCSIKEKDGQWRRMHCNRHQVALCQDESFYEDIQKTMQNKLCDGIIVMIHAGIQYSKTPSPDVRLFTQKAVDVGAFLVLGNHPHVPQSITRIKPSSSSQAEDKKNTSGALKDSSGPEKEGNDIWHGYTDTQHEYGDEERNHHTGTDLDEKDALVVWSIGNFVSHQPKFRGSSGMLFFQVEAQKDDTNNTMRLYVPCYEFQPFCMREKYRLHVTDISDTNDPCIDEGENLASFWHREYMRSTVTPGNFQCKVFAGRHAKEKEKK